MHYFVYLDELGHIGPFISRDDPKHNTSPVFGFGGIAIPIECVRTFSMFFYARKCSLLKWEIETDQDQTPPYKWEKKGSSLYTHRNITKYPELRQTSFRIINKIKAIDGFVFYSAIEKDPPASEHTSEGLYLSVLRDSIRRLDNLCKNDNANFSLFLDAIDSDEPGAKRKFRPESIAVAGSEMFGSHNGTMCHSLIEPPYQLESHLFQNMQCADWFCGLLNRCLTYQVLPDQYPENMIFEKYFKIRLNSVVRGQSIRIRVH